MENIIKLADLLDEIQPGMPGNTAESPSTQVLASVCTDEEARVATLCELSYKSAEEIGEKHGEDPDYLTPILEKDSQTGILMSYNDSGTLKYRRVPWIPGVLEYLLLNKSTSTELVAKFFEVYNQKSDEMLVPNMYLSHGGLRTIPIMESVESESKILSYEQLKPFLDNATKFSVNHCACRTAAHLLGRGCEHMIETCINVNDYADYSIRTNRGREITREEAETILKKCEEEGLVHQVFNTQGPGNTCFICNCCGCSCTSLRSANLMNLQVANRSNFVSKVDPEKCVGCGACVEACNTNALALGSSFCGDDVVQLKTDVPDVEETEWGEQYWDKDFMVRKMVNEYGTAPCKTACPAHISVQGYIRKAHEGKFDEALKVIKRDNPFPAICGRVCPKDCEKECTRKHLDEAIAIDDIKKYIADKELDEKNLYIPVKKEHKEGKVAVIGGGPAGLTCAYYASVEGFDVTVFEKEEEVGGMMMFGIPSFRLQKDVVRAEIEVLRKLGVEFRTGVEIGKDVTIQQLREQGYKAFYMAIGLQDGGRLGVPGDDLANVMPGIDLMRKVNSGQEVKLNGKVVIIGGGNIGADVARTAVRCGADKVSMFCLESYDEMPCGEEDRQAITDDGVELNNSWGQVEVFGQDGKVCGIKFRKCLSVRDEEGRFAPKFDDNDTKTVEADCVIYCIGQKVNYGGLLENSAIELTGRKTVSADAMTYQTAEPDIFAGGDVVTGQKFVIDAIACGKSAAISISRYLQGHNLKIRREREYHALDKANLDLDGYDKMPRQRPANIASLDGKKTFLDPRTDLTDEQIMKESDRCLGCGRSTVDEYKCIGCGVCTTKCEFDAIKLHRRSEVAPPNNTEEFMAEFMAHMQQRMMKIATKSGAAKEATNEMNVIASASVGSTALGD